jgi:hypothetical protein
MLTAPTSVGAVSFLAQPNRCTTPMSCPSARHHASIDGVPGRLARKTRQESLARRLGREARAIMPNITMLDIEALRQTKLKPYIDKCIEHRAPDPGFHAMMGHNIDLCEAMFVAWDACFNKGRIPHPLKEVIRVQLSRAANCTY